METRLVQIQNYRMHIKDQDKNQAIFVKHSS